MTGARDIAGWGVCCILLAQAAAAAAEPAPRAIRRSDVVFMYDNPALYEAYGCTVLGWAARSSAERIRQAHSQGVRSFSCSVGFRTEFRAVIDFSPDFLDAACRNFAGEPIVVPWLWDHKYKNQPAWWWCTNSPLYRQYLESRLAEIMKAQPDGLHIDDYTGTAGAVTWLSACFCKYCTAGFRRYLAGAVPKEKLAELGITDLESFDYRRFLVDRGVAPEEYAKRRAKLPLAAEFHDFQVKAANAFVIAYRKRAEQLRGEPLALCVNSGLRDPASLMIAPQLSYFCCEVDQNSAAGAMPKRPVYAYKLADGLDRPVAATASGQDWAYISERNLPGLVRTWIALCYAFGQNFMVPHRQWCFTKEKGTHWYAGPTEQYAYLYQFVRRNARLLDGYEALAPVAVVYDNAARRAGMGNIEPICTELAEKNIPFTVVVAGDDWLDCRLDGNRLARLKALIVAKEGKLDEAHRKLIEQAKAQGRLVVWPDERLLQRLLPAPVTVEGSQHVWVAPRAIPDDRAAPVAVHLLNRRYDAGQDAIVPQQALTLRLRRDLLGGRGFTKATLHAPKAESRALDVACDEHYVTVKIPELVLWAILELAG